jgi:UDP-N-acetylglucosamine 2-epimerase (non-hydrolysing)
MTLPEVHLVGACRAEALRLAPIVTAMREQGRLTPILIAAGPDPAAVDETYAAFGLTPQITMPTGTDPGEALRRFDALWAGSTPSAVVLRDCFAAAMAAHWRHIPITQLDAGRRHADLGPGGVESERRLLAQVTTLHMAATPLSAMNLLDEHIAAGDLLLAGSTVADAVQALARRRTTTAPDHRIVLVHVSAARSGPIAAAVRLLGTKHPDLEVITLDAGLPVAERARLIAGAYVVVTDDEDLPEEALAAGTPALVLGEAAAQPEALHAESARLVGADPATVTAEVATLLEARVRRDGMATGGNPFGDGLAAYRIAQATAALLGHGQFPEPMPARPVAGVAR